MSKTLKPLMDELIQKIRVGLTDYGFEFKKKDGDFLKKISSGRWCVRLGFIKHTNDFDVVMGVSGRIEALEKLVNGEKDSVDTCYSFGAELGNISEDRQRRWTVTSQKDLDHVALSMLEAFVQIGLPYLKKYSDMENTLDAFSGDDRTAWLHSPVHDARAKRAIGLAFLLNKKEIFHKLAEQKAVFLKSRNDPYLQSFLDFRHELESRLKCDNK